MAVGLAVGEDILARGVRRGEDVRERETRPRVRWREAIVGQRRR